MKNTADDIMKVVFSEYDGLKAEARACADCHNWEGQIITINALNEAENVLVDAAMDFNQGNFKSAFIRLKCVMEIIKRASNQVREMSPYIESLV